VLGAGLGGGEDRGGEGVDGRADECDDECAEEIAPGTDADVPELDNGIPEGEPGLEPTVDPSAGPGPELSVEPAETVPEVPTGEPTLFT
jgi:hypothetical protein